MEQIYIMINYLQQNVQKTLSITLPLLMQIYTKLQLLVYFYIYIYTDIIDIILIKIVNNKMTSPTTGYLDNYRNVKLKRLSLNTTSMHIIRFIL